MRPSGVVSKKDIGEPTTAATQPSCSRRPARTQASATSTTRIQMTAHAAREMIAYTMTYSHGLEPWCRVSADHCVSQKLDPKVSACPMV
eukprot:scaffold100396_cov33-Tisochrysis_lutea.AAC.8